MALNLTILSASAPRSSASLQIHKALSIGNRVSACVATIGYIIYAAAMLGYSKGVIGGAGVVAGGAALGVGGGLFCTVQVWRLTGVPAPEDEGKHIALFYLVG